VLWLATALVATRGWGRQGAAQPPPEPLFSEVMTSASGISWCTTTRCRENHYLPETLGPGCAFLDYDNDGWMDIFLVNSALARFLETDEAGAQRALQEQPEWHV